MNAFARRLLILIALSLSAITVAAAESPPFPLFDSHAHFISADLDRYPLHRPPPPPGVSRNPLGTGLLERLKTNPPTAENILRLWDDNGVTAGAGVQYRTAYGADNSYLLDSAAAHPRRVTAIVLLDALDPNTPYTFRSMVRDAGAAGVRFSGAPDPDTGGYAWLTSRNALKTWDAANELGAVIVLMPLPPGSPDPKAFAAIANNARSHPNVDVILDHFGWVEYSGAPDYGISDTHLTLRSIPNIYFKLSSINLTQLADAGVPAADFVRRAVDVFGADRIMWGSDVGNTREEYKDMVAAAIEATAKLTPEERRRVLHDTGQEVHVAGGRGPAP